MQHIRRVEPDRNEQGMPKEMAETEWPGNWACVNGGPGTQPITASFEQKNTKNDSLPYLIAASVASAIALTLCVVGYIFGPQYIEARLRAQFAQDIADARAEARAAGTDATIWKNRVVGIEKQLEAERNVKR